MSILIADDHPIFRDGLRHAVGEMLEGEEVFEAGDMASVRNRLNEIDELSLLVLDLYFPGFDVARDFKELRHQLRFTPILVISMTYRQDEINAVMDAGANGFVSKSVKPGVIKEAIRCVLNGERVVRLASGMIGPAAQAETDPEFLGKLPNRQLQVLKLIAKGKSNKEIAAVLEISPNTVRIHVSSLFESLGVTSRSAAAAIAAARGLG